MPNTPYLRNVVPTYSNSSLGKPQVSVDESMSGWVDGWRVAYASENGCNWRTQQMRPLPTSPWQGEVPKAVELGVAIAI